MEFSALMNEVKSMFESWKNDETIVDKYCGDEEKMQKDFLQCIQGAIGSDFIVITEREFEEEKMIFHECMEGTFNKEDYPHRYK